MLWIVIRSPTGRWGVSAPTDDAVADGCEVYHIYASSEAEAKKKAQSIRSNHVRSGIPLPTQSAPYARTSTRQPVNVVDRQQRRCLFCGSDIPKTARSDAKFCCPAHRQLSHKQKRQGPQGSPLQLLLHQIEKVRNLERQLQIEVDQISDIMTKHQLWSDKTATQLLRDAGYGIYGEVASPLSPHGC